MRQPPCLFDFNVLRTFGLILSEYPIRPEISHSSVRQFKGIIGQSINLRKVDDAVKRSVWE